MRKIFSTCFLYAAVLICHGQQTLVQTDSLQNLSLQELDDLTVDLESTNDTLNANLVAKQLVLKAKTLNHYKYIARGFYTLTNLATSQNYKESYVDSMLFFSKLSKEKYLLTDSYYLKSNIEYYKGNYQKAMEQLAEAYKYAVLDENIENQRFIATNMASIKSVLQRHYEAHTIYKDAYNDYNVEDFNEMKNKDYYLDLLYNLTLTFSELKQYDSTLIYSNKGKQLSKLYASEEYSNSFKRSQGIGYLGTGKLDRAIKLLNETKTGLSKHDEAHSHFYLAKAYHLKNKPKEAKDNFLKADSILSVSNAAPFPELKDAYKFLYLEFEKLGDTLQSKKYLSKFITLDSLLTAKNSSISESLHNLYSLPRLKSENAAKVRAKKKYAWALTSLIILSIAALIYILVQNKRVKKQKARIQNLLKKDSSYSLKDSSSLSILSVNSPSIIKDDVTQELLLKLSDFESNLGYLESDVTLAKLAKNLNTNSSYLSATINNNKGMNFPAYLKNLRINYSINSLKTNQDYLKYSMNGLAEEFGFNNSDSFSKAFKEVTKINPSLFIKELGKRKSSP